VGLAVIFILYSFTGGLVASTWSNFIQGLLIIVVSTMLVPLGWSLVGGFSGMRQTLPAFFFSMATPKQIGPWFIAMLTLNGLIGIMAQPHMIAAVGTGKDEYTCRVGFLHGTASTLSASTMFVSCTRSHSAFTNSSRPIICPLYSRRAATGQSRSQPKLREQDLMYFCAPGYGGDVMMSCTDREASGLPRLPFSEYSKRRCRASEQMSSAEAALVRWETPRLCRGGSKSLTNTGVHRGNSLT